MTAWITTEEAAAQLKVSGSRVRAMAASGLLMAEKRGRDLVVSEDSVRVQRSAYGQLTTAMRIRVFVRDALTCQRCGLVGGEPGQLHVHHKKPRALGGTNGIENLETLCCDCHHAEHGWGSLSYLSKTYRLDDDVIAALEKIKELYGSVNKALRAILIDGAPAHFVEPSPPDASFEARHSRAADALGSARPSESASTLKIESNSLTSNHCVHCGRDSERPEGTRPSTMCNFCGRDGHQPWGICKKCAEEAELEKRRASSTACDTSDIDLNPNWGA